MSLIPKTAFQYSVVSVLIFLMILV
jgi:hypothetical protein